MYRAGWKAAKQDAQAAITTLQSRIEALEKAGQWVYPMVESYESVTGIQVNEAFKIGFDMARTTNVMLDGIFPTAPQEAP